MPKIEQLRYEFEQALLSLDRLKARKLFQQVADTLSPMELVEELIYPALLEIGQRWEDGTAALSQVYMSGRICEELVNAALPLPDQPLRGHPKIAIAVLEDHHTLGKRTIYTAIRSIGFDISDYGHGLTSDALVKRVKEDEIDILLISTLMLRAALQIKGVTTQLKKQKLNTKVVVGGAPFLFDEQLWQDVDADMMGRNTTEAIEIVRKLTAKEAAL